MPMSTNTKTVIVAIITSITSVFTTWMALPNKPATAIDKQGLRDLSIEGMWLYVCTDYNEKYQHGGRFEVKRNIDGSLKLEGQRMWKDIQNDTTRKWKCNNFQNEKIIRWSSKWIYVHDENQFNMEYEMDKDGEIIKGYCTGAITSEDKQVERIDGYFYQLLPRTPLLAGRIIFYKVSKGEYNNPSWRKNHNCD